MKSVLISIKPKWCELIVSGKKTIEVRKTRPKLETPFKCYIYCTKELHSGLVVGGGKVIGDFMCDKITHYPFEDYNDGEHLMPFGELEKTCLDGIEIYDYLRTKDGYGWHISDLKIYDEPKELSEFKGRKLVWRGNNHIHEYEELTRPPQSWCYVK